MSDILKSVYKTANELYESGATSETTMHKFEEVCLTDETQEQNSADLSNKELLTLAAKSIDLPLEWKGPPGKQIPMYYRDRCYHDWNPLEDISDALYLKEKLGLKVRKHYLEFYVELDDGYRVVKYIGDDARESIRKIIVMAAAHIGSNDS